MQEEEPAEPAAVPSGQAVQVACPLVSWNFPIAQSVQVMAPEAEYLPVSHSSQEEDAVESWLLPGSQELHEDAPEREYSPRSQEMHMVAFAALHFPAVQSLQMPLAWA